MHTRKLLASLAVLLFFLSLFTFRTASAGAVSITRTFSSLAYDGEVVRETSDYLTAYYSMTGTVENFTSMILVGQSQETEPPYLYTIIKAFLFFDTSMIPDTATITSAKLSLDIFNDASLEDFNVTLKQGFPITTFPHAPLQTGDYYYGHYIDDGGSRSTSELSGTGYWNITLNTEGLTWIDKEDGLTRFALASSRWGYEPTSYETIGFYSYEAGETKSPKLIVTYTTEGYLYMLHGGYYETNGLAANCIVNVTAQMEGSASQSFILNGTDGIADDYNVTAETRVIAFTWNISSEGMNHTRTYYVEDKTFEEIWIYVPSTADPPIYLYTFNIVDLAGIKNSVNAYFSLIRNVAGANRIIERQVVNIQYDIPFWMIWQGIYSIRIECLFGYYTWSPIKAETNLSPSLIIMRSNFPIMIPGFNATASGARMNSTWLQANYSDGQSITLSLLFTVKHREDSGWFYDYYENVSDAQAYQLNWYTADPNTDYKVDLAAQRTDTEYYWSFAFPRMAATANPMEGFLDSLGKFPFNPAQFLGMFILFFAFALGSYLDHVAGLFLGIIIAALLTYSGFLAISWTLISTGAVIVGFVAIAEYKRRVREYEIP